MSRWLEAVRSSNNCYRAIAVAAVVLYCALAIGSALTKRPEVDEGMFASPAFNLLTKGSMGTTVLEKGGSSLKDIHEYTYWTPPLHLLTQAAWYKLFGFSLLSMRAISVVWGLVALAAWFLLMMSLSADRKLALLTLVLLSVDYTFIVGASLGRMDMMSAALGFAAFAAYLGLRERSLTWAVLASQSLVVASGLSHPNGILPFAGLLFLTLYYDRQRIAWRHLLFALIPYLIGGVGWGLYIMQDPSAFVAQVHTNSVMGGRLIGLRSPWLGFTNEFTQRYPHAFGLGVHSAGHTGPIYLKVLLLIPYVLALGGAVFTRSIRGHMGYRALLIITAIYFLLLSLIDGQKETTYLIHIVPFYVAILAIWIRHCWINRLVPVSVLIVGMVGFVSLEIGGTLYRMRQNTYHNLYLPTIDFLQRNSDQSQLVMGNSALGFGLKFPDNLVDDALFGYITGKRPDFIVFDDERAQELSLLKTQKPQLYQYLNRLFTEEYQKVYDNPAFQVYARR